MLGWLLCFQFSFFGAKFKKSSRKRKKHKWTNVQGTNINRQQALDLVLSIEHTSRAWSTCGGPVASNRHACLTLDVTRPLRVTEDSWATPWRAETPPTALVFRRHVGKDCDVWRVLEWYENEREKQINGGIGLGWDARRSTHMHKIKDEKGRKKERHYCSLPVQYFWGKCNSMKQGQIEAQDTWD